MFEGTSDYGEVLICDGANKPFFFKMTGTGALADRTFFAGEITVDSTTAPTVGVIHENHFVVGGAPTAKNKIFFKFDQSKSRVNATIEIPKTDPAMQTNITGFLPYLSL